MLGPATTPLLGQSRPTKETNPAPVVRPVETLPVTPPARPHPTPPRPTPVPTPTPTPVLRPPRVVVIPGEPQVVVNNTTVVQQAAGSPANTLGLTYPRAKIFLRHESTARSITVENLAQGRGAQPIAVYDYTFPGGPQVHWECNAVMPGRDVYEFWIKYPNQPAMKVDIVYYGTPVTVWNDRKLLITLGYEQTPL